MAAGRPGLRCRLVQRCKGIGPVQG
jgi:hypothetical protein